MLDANTKAGPGYYRPEELTEDAFSFYREKGFLVVEDALDTDALVELKKETVALCRGERGDVTDAPPVSDDMNDDAVQGQVLCIHHPHKISPLVRDYLAEPTIQRVLQGVIGPNTKCMQSMLFIKSAGKPGQAWHQDEDFIPTRDRSLMGAWIAIDDATVNNGCLWILPGSHRPGVLWPMHAHTDKRFDCTHESHGFPFRDEDAVAVEVKAGSIVFFNGYTLHRSLPNRKESGFRRVLVNHYMSSESLLPWRAREDQPVATTDYRDITVITGKDPYAWKGTEDIAAAHIRADGNGGCSDGRTLQ